jgi:fatty acid desaturase
MTTETNTVVLTTTIALTDTMVQLPFFTVGIYALYYISTFATFFVALGVFLFSYGALRPSKERITRSMAFGLAIIYALFAGIFIWPLIPLFLRGDQLSLIFTQHVTNLIMLVLLLIFATPVVIIYARMLSRHNKSSQS